MLIFLSNFGNHTPPQLKEGKYKMNTKESGEANLLGPNFIRLKSSLPYREIAGNKRDMKEKMGRRKLP